jgi:hypothetical protein
MGSGSVFRIVSSFVTLFVLHFELCAKLFHVKVIHDFNVTTIDLAVWACRHPIAEQVLSPLMLSVANAKWQKPEHIARAPKYEIKRLNFVA